MMSPCNRWKPKDMISPCLRSSKSAPTATIGRRPTQSPVIQYQRTTMCRLPNEKVAQCRCRRPSGRTRRRRTSSIAACRPTSVKCRLPNQKVARGPCPIVVHLRTHAPSTVVHRRLSPHRRRSSVSSTDMSIEVPQLKRIYEQRHPASSGNLPKLGSNKVCSLPLIVGLAFDGSDNSCIFFPAQ